MYICCLLYGIPVKLKVSWPQLQYVYANQCSSTDPISTTNLFVYCSLTTQMISFLVSSSTYIDCLITHDRDRSFDMQREHFCVSQVFQLQHHVHSQSLTTLILTFFRKQTLSGLCQECGLHYGNLRIRFSTLFAKSKSTTTLARSLARLQWQTNWNGTTVQCSLSIPREAPW